MRFKTSNLKEAKHSDLVSCVSWMSPDDVISIADDHKILKWNLVSAETQPFAELPQDFHPTDVHWLPKGQASGAGSRGKGGASGSDVFLVTSAEGKLQLIGKNGRMEKSVDAHRGACLVGRWSHDGAGIVTGGEDGAVKVWSRSGMLRSTLASTTMPVYALSWSPDSSHVLYATDKLLTIKPLAPNSKPIQWKAHEGLILCLDWSPSNYRIISGGEDCRYKVWDQFGRQLFNSSQHDYPITSVSWSVDGQLFAVGSFNTLRLCDKIGWSHSLDKPATGSLYKIAWSADGTQVAAACGNGHVIFAHVIEKRIEWKEFEATVTGRKTISLRNVTNDAWEKLEFRDRIIQVSMDFGYLIVATTSQCYIYTTRNWNTPTIFDLKEGSVSLIIPAEKHFLLVESNALHLYSYEARLICSPKWPGMRPETLNAHTVSLCNDTIAVRDQSDEKNVHLFDATNGKALNDGRPFTHRQEIAEIALDQVGLANQRKLAIVDKNRDLFVANVRKFGKVTSTQANSAKIGAMVQSLKWNANSNMLAAILDSRFCTYLYPAVIFVDRNLLHRTIIERDSGEFGKNPTIVLFSGNSISVRRADGSLVTTAVSPYPGMLFEYTQSNRWSEATKLCRFVKDETLWACLAGISTQARHLETAEVSYSAIQEADKVHYIQYIKELPSKEAQNAEMAVLTGNYQDAENILLQAGLTFRAILLNIYLHQWDRALDLAIKHKTHVDTVLAYRVKHLNRCDKDETIPRYIQYMKEVDIDWEKIGAKIEEEYHKEREMGGRTGRRGSSVS